MILLGLSHAGKTSVGRLLAERLGRSFYDTDELIRIRTGLTPRELCRQAGLSALHTAEAAALRECCTMFMPCSHNLVVEAPLRAAVFTGNRYASVIEKTSIATEPFPVSQPLQTGGSADKRQGIAVENCAVIAAGGGICDNTEASAIIAAISQRIFLYAEEVVLFERLTYDATQTGHYPAFLGFLPAVQKTKAQRLFTELYARRTELYRRSCNLIIDTSGLDCIAVAQKIAIHLQERQSYQKNR